MNNKGKVIIAAILFIFLGLTVFTFANPNEDTNTLNSVTKNEVTNNNQVTDIFNQEDNNNADNDRQQNNNNAPTEQQQNNNAPNEQQQNNNVEPVVNNSYEKALAAVINAEEKLDETSYNEALQLVELVTEEDNKEELTNRLENVKYGIDVKSLVITLETMTNEANNKEEMNSARSYREDKNIATLVATLTNEVLKEELQIRLNDVAKILDDEELIVNIANEALLKEKQKIEIVDQNDLTIILTDKEGTREIQNGEELLEGVYTLNVKDSAFNELIITFTIDTNAPNLTIVSPEIYQLEVYTEYIDKGYSAHDTLEGDITNLIELSYEFKERGNTEYITTDKIDNSKVGTYKITYTAYDKVGNETVGTREVEFVDTVSPVINLPGTKGAAKNELHVESGTKVTYEDLLATVTDATAVDFVAPYTATLYGGPSIEDNKYGITDFTNGLDTNHVGRYNIEYMVTDKGGNTTTATMLLVMTDTTAPVINLPGTLGKNKNELHVESGTKVTYEDLLATVTDATADKTIAPYDASLLISSIVSENKYNIKDFTNGLDTNHVGRYNIEYMVTDKGGNTTTATMLLVMTDTTAPVINLPGTLGKNKNELHVEYGSKITYEDLIATVTDATAVDSIAPYKAHLLVSNIKEENTYNIKDFTNGLDTNYLGRYNIEYMVTDKGGNTTISTMLLIMRDTEKPVLTDEITYGRTFIRGTDKTHLQFNIYKDGELKHSFNSKTSEAGKYFSLSTGWFGDGEYTIEAIDEGNNKTILNTIVTSNESTLIKYNDSLKLTKDATLNEVLEILEGQDKVIDLNGYTLTVQNTDEENKYAKQPLQIKGKLTIKDSSNGKTGILVNDSSNANGLIENYATGNIILDDITIKDKGTGTLITNNGGKVRIVKSDLVTEKANTTVENNAGDLTIKETNITIKGKAYATWIHSGNVIIEDTNINSVRGGMNIDGGNVVVNDTNITLNGNGTTQSYYAVYVYNKNNSKVTINGGTFIGSKGSLCLEIRNAATGKTSVEVNGGIFSATKDSTAAVKIAKDPEIEQIDLTIKGGTFKNTNVTTYLAKGYEQNLTNWIVTLNEILSIKYNDSVKLTKDATLEEIIEISKGQSKIIDLNGNTLNVNNSTTKSFKNDGQLTIKNGKIVNDISNNNGIIENGKNGDLILDNVTIADTGKEHLIENNGGKVTITKSNITIENSIAIVAHNGGDLVIQDTKIKANNTAPGYPVLITDGNAVIEKTDIDGKYGGINIKGGTVTITDVNVTLPKSGSAHHAIYIANVKDSNVTINGGTFAGRRGGLYLHALARYQGKISVIVNDGTFSANRDSSKTVHIESEAGTQTNLTIKGGKFIKDDVTEYLADGYKQNSDGTVTTE